VPPAHTTTQLGWRLMFRPQTKGWEGPGGGIERTFRGLSNPMVQRRNHSFQEGEWRALQDSGGLSSGEKEPHFSFNKGLLGGSGGVQYRNGLCFFFAQPLE